MLFTFICIFILILFFIALLSFYAGMEEVKRQAIVAGAAHYKTVVSKNGGVNNEFVWGAEKK